METAFIDAYLTCFDPQHAAKLAGVKSLTHGYQILNRPAIREEIQRLSSERLHFQLVPLAHRHLASVLQEGSSASVRDKSQAASIVLKYASEAAANVKEGEKALHELSPDELNARLARLSNELAERAKPVVLTIEANQEDLFA